MEDIFLFSPSSAYAFFLLLSSFCPSPKHNSKFPGDGHGTHHFEGFTGGSSLPCGGRASSAASACYGTALETSRLLINWVPTVLVYFFCALHFVLHILMTIWTFLDKVLVWCGALFFLDDVFCCQLTFSGSSIEGFFLSFLCSLVPLLYFYFLCLCLCSCLVAVLLRSDLRLCFCLWLYSVTAILSCLHLRFCLCCLLCLLLSLCRLWLLFFVFHLRSCCRCSWCLIFGFSFVSVLWSVRFFCCCVFSVLGSALRVPPAETRLTVYRRFDIGNIITFAK